MCLVEQRVAHGGHEGMVRIEVASSACCRSGWLGVHDMGRYERCRIAPHPIPLNGTRCRNDMHMVDEPAR